MSLTVTAQDFPVPSHVHFMGSLSIADDIGSSQPLEGLPLAMLHPEALSRLCDQFRADCFAKAGYADPELSETSVEA